MDAFLFQKINEIAFRNSWFDALGIFFAEYFSYIVVFCLIAFLLWNFKKYYSMVILAFTAGIVARIITEMIRLFWVRPRPFVENYVKLLVPYLETASFPSGHAAFFFSIAGIIYFCNKNLGVLFFISAFLISITRVFCGIHWLTDIIAGFFVGIFSAFVVIQFSRKINEI